MKIFLGFLTFAILLSPIPIFLGWGEFGKFALFTAWFIGFFVSAVAWVMWDSNP